MCAGISGNLVTGSGRPDLTGADIEVDQGGVLTFRLPGYAGAAGDTSAVESYLAAANGGTASALAVMNGPANGFTGGAACASPS
jgi:hypothetical protein